MIGSFLPDKLHNVTQNGSFKSPCYLWEQEFNRYPSTVKRIFVLCSGVIESSQLLVCHTKRLPRAPVLCGNRSSAVIRQPVLTVFMRQPGLQPGFDPELYLSLIFFERSP